MGVSPFLIEYGADVFNVDTSFKQAMSCYLRSGGKREMFRGAKS